MTTAVRAKGTDRRVLLTVSGTIPDGLAAAIARGDRPRADYIELASAFDADVLDRSAATATFGPLATLLARIVPADVVVAAACFWRRRRYDVVVTDGEQVGFPLAAMLQLVRRRPRHVMIAHRLSPPKKVRVHRLLRLRRRIDTVVVYATTQRDVAVGGLGYRPDQVVLTPFMVDTRFWTPESLEVRARPRLVISAAGQELRDYPTMVEAIRGLDVDVVLAAASPWSKRADSSKGIDLPANVEVTRLDLFALRQLYADSALVVVPLQETDFQAGITTILEAMSMARAVVCTRTTGQTDTIADGETGLYVPPGDVAALRQAIERLLGDERLRARLGAAARRWVVEHADVDVYAERLAELTR